MVFWIAFVFMKAPSPLAPYESRVIVFSDAPLNAAPVAASGKPVVVADLGTDWKLAFPGTPPKLLKNLVSWTEDETTRHFSGEAVYTKDVKLSAGQLKGTRLSLDFGPGTALASTPKVPAGMRAMFDSPIREAAQVLVNGKPAGALWHPPYRIDITPLLRAGTNKIEVRVANLAVNTLAGRTLPDYRLLSARYGQRFVPQDTELIVPRPAGMMGPVTLTGEKSE